MFLAVSSVIKLLLNLVQPESFIWAQSACSTQHHIMTEDCDIVKGKRKKPPLDPDMSTKVKCLKILMHRTCETSLCFSPLPCSLGFHVQLHKLSTSVVSNPVTFPRLSPPSEQFEIKPECSVSKDIISSDSSVIVSASVYERCLTTHRHSK